LSPQLIPLLICLGAIPILLFFSLVAGWSVWRSVPEGWQIPVYLIYGDGGPPYADFVLPDLSSNQAYDVSFHLRVPNAEANFALGNFMTSLTLLTARNVTIAHLRRPSIILPPSSLFPLSLLRSRQLLEMTVPLLSSFVPGVSRVQAHLELGRKDGWKGIGSGQGREISVHSAFLRGDVRAEGLSGIYTRILTSFPLSLAIASSIAFFVLSLIILSACVVSSIRWRVAKDPSTGSPNSSADPSTSTKPRRRSSTYSQDLNGAHALPASPHSYPSPEPELQIQRRIRRRSSSSGGII